jgi:inorganic phosphate transporter, PiT family
MALEITGSRVELSFQLPRPTGLAKLALALAFMLACAGYAWFNGHALPQAPVGLGMLALAALVGGYMAMNIGANDVANNMGPIVGAKAIPIGWALLIAAVFEALGAIVAGGAVVSTVKNSIIDPRAIADAADFAWLMLSALLAAALWLHLATFLGAPVSTTHSIVGAVLGAGIAAGGTTLVNWQTMGAIVASWVISPLTGGLIAAGLLYLCKRLITWQGDMNGAAARWVPVLIGLMAWAFASYMLVKGAGALVKMKPGTAVLWGLGVGVAVWALMRGPVARRARVLAPGKDSVNRLFVAPLVCAAALLCFAHGANDVANAVGPLAAIHEVVAQGVVVSKASTPLWVLVLGALGLSVGLLLYGGKLIRTVGHQITELDALRVYAITMASALTVIVASHLGMPISTTHVAIGALFGVGLLREAIKRRRGLDAAACRQVDRRAALRIVAAWLVTVPATALLAALGFLVLRHGVAA